MRRFVYCEYCTLPFAVEENKYLSHLSSLHNINEIRKRNDENAFWVHDFSLFLRNTRTWWENNLWLPAIIYQRGIKKSVTSKHISFEEGRITFANTVYPNLEAFELPGSTPLAQICSMALSDSVSVPSMNKFQLIRI